MRRLVTSALCLALTIACVSLFLASCSTKQEELPRRVLAIHSYGIPNGEYPQQAEHCYEQSLATRATSMDVRHIYLQHPITLKSLSHRILRDSLQALAAQHWAPEVVILHNDPAVKQYLSMTGVVPELATVPCVYVGTLCAHRHLHEEAYSHLRATGFHDSLYVHENLAMVSELWPEHTSCMVELDSTEEQLFALDELRRALSDTTRYIDNSDFHIGKEESLRMQREGTGGKFMLYTISFEHLSANHPWRPGLGKEAMDSIQRNYIISTLRAAKYMKQVQVCMGMYSNTVIDHSRMPQVSMINAQFLNRRPCRVLGGYFAPLQRHVDDALDYTERILGGEDVRALPEQLHTPDWYLDWYAMQKHGLSETDVDERFHILGLPLRSAIPKTSDYVQVGMIMLAFMLAITCLFALGYIVMRRRARVEEMMLARMEWLMGGKNSAMWKYQMGRLFFTPKLRKLLGTSVKSISVKDFLPFVHPDDQETARRAFTFEEAEGRHSCRMRIAMTGGGDYHWYRLDYTINPITGFRLSVEGLATLIDDEVREETALQVALSSVEETKLKEAFLANMTHDIRNPLSTIVSFADMLGTDGMELSAGERRVFVEQIQQSTDVMLRLLSDIVDVSRMQMGEYRFTKKAWAVSRLVGQAYMANEVLMPKHLEFHKTEGPEAHIMVDSARLAQVLNNFLSNAIKNTADGHITLGWEVRDGMAVIYVEDTGCGISVERQAVIFEKFTKFDCQSGAGLGLNICKTIVEKQGGHIGVESQEGVGSRFWAAFPIYNNE